MMQKCYRAGCIRAAVVHPVIVVPWLNREGLSPLAIVFDGVCEEHQHSLTIRDYVSISDWEMIKERARVRGLIPDSPKANIIFKPVGWRPAKNGRIREGEL